MAKHGSSLLMVLMVVAALSIIAFTVVRNTTFLVDGVLARERSEQQYRAAEGLMNYGIALARSYFNVIKKERKVECNVGTWPPGHSLYVGKLIFKPSKEEIALQAVLEKDKNICCTIQCSVILDDTICKVSNWSIG